MREHIVRPNMLQKRVLKEGSGPPILSNSILRVDMKIYSSVDGTKLDIEAQTSFCITSQHLEDPSSELPSLQQVLVTMRLGEEAWIALPVGLHQENNHSWEDLWYHVKILSIESMQTDSPENWKFLREQKIGPQRELKKRVLCEGYGECPRVNNLVTYYYTIFRSDGKEFERYTNKSHILPKILPQDTCLGIYYALWTMREAEECLVQLPPGYFKGKCKETLWASVQLLYINECQNALYPQNQEFFSEEDLGSGVIKRVLKEGTGEVIQNVAKVWLEIEGWLEDSYQFQKFKTQVVTFNKEGKKMGVSEELLLQTMRKGEVSFVKAPPGTHVYDDTLEHETLWIKYTLVEYLEHILDLNTMKSLSEKMEYSCLLIEIGNRLFRSGIRSESKAIYNRINSVLTVKPAVFKDFEDEIKIRYNNLKSRVLSNLALVFLKDAEEFKDKDLVDKATKKVIEYAGIELEMNPWNVKNMCRRAKAFEIRGEFEKAKEDLDKALGIEAGNSEARKLHREIIGKIKEENCREKKVFKEVFTKENWEKEAMEDEERLKKIEEGYDAVEEEEQEQVAKEWIEKLQTQGLLLDGVGAVNLLLS